MWRTGVHGEFSQFSYSPVSLRLLLPSGLRAAAFPAPRVPAAPSQLPAGHTQMGKIAYGCMCMAHSRWEGEGLPGITKTFFPRKSWSLCVKAYEVSTVAAAASSSSAWTSQHLHSTGVIGQRCWHRTLAGARRPSGGSLPLQGGGIRVRNVILLQVLRPRTW